MIRTDMFRKKAIGCHWLFTWDPKKNLSNLHTKKVTIQEQRKFGEYWFSYLFHVL